ncbi:MAG: ATP-binding cassette domain-containing protein [Candidatus Marinimicrobia bacterium]|jgi:lipopolysaccharide transport system ATP-binding protein|nr:ATP-binding cassette domain-containing protein [Candidatus Neomarinimicrobiota bacterium]MBT7823162.1 ATP-binding cassette domain-containing protein [Candidatus Neomarinimicrobiota bacterium]
MTDVAIKVENISKQYRIGLEEETKDTFVGAMGSILKSPFQNLKRINKLTSFNENKNESNDIIWALKGISFEVKRGEVLGIIGANGAGKSTLLKILAQITHPTTGSVELNGKVASLLEVGTGFHPELTGRENIYLNGTILGMTKKEIDSKLVEIIDFSGVQKFIDTPVKRYSSGMRVRLAFSVAAHLEPEILLIDEVLAVGDAEFQKKCLGKMEEIATQGRTIIYVSHNMASILSLCTKCIFINDGKIRYSGEPEFAISNYLQNNVAQQSVSFYNNYKLSDTSQEVELVEAELLLKDGSRVKNNIVNQQIGVRIKYNLRNKKNDIIPSINISGNSGNKLFTSFERDINQSMIKVGVIESIVWIPDNLFSNGQYSISITFFYPTIGGIERIIITDKILSFIVLDKAFTKFNRVGNQLYPNFTWEFHSI